MRNQKKYTKLDPVQKVAIVNSRLRHGDLSRIARDSGVSSNTVTKVIEGNSENLRVLNIAYNLTRKRKKNFTVIKDMSTRIARQEA